MQASLDALKLGSIVRAEGDSASPLPLERTDVAGQITGPVAVVRVTQTFGNPFKEPIALTYLFPLPHEAAVVDYEIRIGARVIRAEMKELQAARQAYQEAVEAGKRAGLLEQRRPNLFAVQVGNVMPNEQIIATLTYQERLRYEDDHYEFVFPMDVTPKFHADPQEAANVDSPIAAPGERIGPVALTLNVDTGVPAGDPSSPSHPVHVARQDERHYTVRLPDGVIPNKDFVLRYPVASDAVRAAAWLGADSDADTALVTVLPPHLTEMGEPAPREFIFVLDRSGSMQGAPITQAKNALRACLRSLGAKDTFRLQAFDNVVEWFSGEAQAMTQTNVNAADAWLNGIEGRGGTDILAAIDAALAVTPDPTRTRYVVFLTDGAVSADDKALDKIRKQRGTARIFTFGIGPSVNRSLLVRIARLGHGTAQFLQLTEDLEKAITRFQDRVSYPVLEDLRLDWQNVEAWDTYPEVLADLYVGQPLELVTRLKRKGAEASLIVSGKRGDQPVTVVVPIPAASEADPALKRLWARARVDSLMESAPLDDNKRQQIIGLAIDNRLLTAFTAFVAVDSEVANKSGDTPRKVDVAIPLPEGLDIQGFVGGGVLTASGVMPQAARYRMAPPAPMAANPKMMASAPKAGRSLDLGGIGRGVNRLVDRLKEAAPHPAQSEADERVARYTEPPEPTDAPATPKVISDMPVLAGKSGAAAAEERLKWLARTQNVNGSWGQGESEVEMTATALLAFVRAGHTTRSGDYRRQVSKAVEWLKAAVANGFAFFIRYRALRELEAALNGGEKVLTDDLYPSIGEPITDIERAALAIPGDKAPAAINTLDDLRIAALIVGEVAEADIKGVDRSSPLVQAWLAVGKPKSL